MQFRSRKPAIQTVAIPSAFLLAALAGCGGSSPTSSSGGGDTPPPPANRTIMEDPSFSQTIQEIFERRGCTQSACHGSDRMANLDLRRGSSYGSLVGVPSTNEGTVRVIPGDPDGSYLVIKLEGRQRVGVRMPQIGAPLDDIDLTNIRNWISQGAKNN